MGSNPINPLNDTDEYYTVNDTDSNSYIKTLGYNYKFKNTILNNHDYYTNDPSMPLKDLLQTYKLNIRAFSDTSLSNNYIMPSRTIYTSNNKTFFARCIIGNDGSNNGVSLCEVSNNGSTAEKSVHPGIRPVIRLKENVKIKNPTADGSKDNPYELTIE